ncbi:Chemotaxis protein methyltransferase [Rubripirellula obstinata]|uniref:protein-glutamate O-methyltransferase n=1 Tax=Rubripirellula obstinata TaxID=406547 RepID=A0A5B1CMG4_9BACT|nr:protein-glutamate O-methyltransferase CheR [Rubripirellula obstinata]KAA1262377.1 Chemotaxis protein methyltransferase [Rubripirellula obstinata]
MITLTEEQFKRFQALIYKHSGIRLDDRKQTLLRSRLQRRLRQIDMDDVDQYYRIVTTPNRRDELQALIDVVTTNETSFFRTESHFQWFSDSFLMDAIRDGKKGLRQKSLRLWSAACSVGAEPYTLLFCMHEKRAVLDGWNIEILASDLSTDTLATAQSGRFKKRLIDGLDDKQTKRFFREIEGFQPEYEVRPEFAEKIDFFQHNLMDRLRKPPMDCIFLRNVLIYFDDVSKQKVIANIAETLVPGGYLVIGPSEGIYGLDNPLTKISTFLYQKPPIEKT